MSGELVKDSVSEKISATFKELLNSVTFEEVAPCLLQMHPDAYCVV